MTSNQEALFKTEMIPASNPASNVTGDVTGDAVIESL